MEKQKLIIKRDAISSTMDREIKDSPKWLELQKELLATSWALTKLFNGDSITSGYRKILCYA